MLISEKLLNLRKQKGLTQEQLACDLNVSRFYNFQLRIGFDKTRY